MLDRFECLTADGFVATYLTGDERACRHDRGRARLHDGDRARRRRRARARAERSRGGCRCSGRSTSRMYTVWIDLARARTFENNISKNLEDSRKCSHQGSDDLVRLGPLLTGGTNGY